ncbi:MAG: YkgJ family cysteine cluster protein [Desulfatiglans sp.]|jgi:Fe-S-cluster containining protein|nr:YkgJ family cysteine cluster protein [Thermodesulfobacteriota bacterium]MEE4354122.1 YkgJ family cysteine cluster protein [Desulfatiglans sp.]
MNPKYLFERYEHLVAGADNAFSKMRKDYSECIKCRPYCSDCCCAVFGLFLIEAVYLKRSFDELETNKRDAALSRAQNSDREIAELQKRLTAVEDDPNKVSLALAKERIRCVLLDDSDECILYASRPITCRVYGIPTSIRGRSHVCGKSGFERHQVYPSFDLDAVYRELYGLSQDLLKAHGIANLEKAGLLLSVSKVIRTSHKDLIEKDYR